MRSINFAFNRRTFALSAGNMEAMTLQGVINKTLVLWLLTAISTLLVGYWLSPYLNDESSSFLSTFSWVSGAAWLLMYLSALFLKRHMDPLAPLFVFFSGVLLGSIGLLLEQAFAGIAFQSIALAFSILFVLLLLYKFRLISPKANFLLMTAALVLGSALFYLGRWLLLENGFFTRFLPEFDIITLVVLSYTGIVASLNTVLDFDFIENGDANSSPKYLEWYAAFGLVSILVWMYLSIFFWIFKLLYHSFKLVFPKAPDLDDYVTFEEADHSEAYRYQAESHLYDEPPAEPEPDTHTETSNTKSPGWFGDLSSLDGDSGDGGD